MNFLSLFNSQYVQGIVWVLGKGVKLFEKYLKTLKKRSPRRIFDQKTFSLLIDIKFCLNICLFFEFYILKKSNFDEISLLSQ